MTHLIHLPAYALILYHLWLRRDRTSRMFGRHIHEPDCPGCQDGY